ncbi:MAG: septation protein A, partial [Candidatus Dechloromonas phosphoritropha]
MKLLFDLFPVILFFATFKYYVSNPEGAAALVGSLLGSAVLDVKQAPILLATIVVITATVAQIAWVHFRHGKVDKMLWVSLVLVSVFGGMTLIFQDETFIKWKPTILYWVFAGSMAFAALVLKKNPIKAMLGEQLTLPDPVWYKVNLSWVTFFMFMGALNLFVAFNFPTETWVNFKLFGGMGLLLLFVLGQG